MCYDRPQKKKGSKHFRIVMVTVGRRYRIPGTEYMLLTPSSVIFES